MMSRQRRQTGQSRGESDWNFRTFPAYFAFASGTFLASLLVYLLPQVWYPVFILALFGFSFGCVHIFSRTIVRGRRSRAQTRAEEDERERRIYAARAAANAENPTPPRKRRRRR
jgi:hypothetical protein